MSWRMFTIVLRPSRAYAPAYRELATGAIRKGEVAVVVESSGLRCSQIANRCLVVKLTCACEWCG